MFTLAWIAAATVYLVSRDIVLHQYNPELRNVASVTDPQGIAEGERLARVFGCFDACHGERMQGAVVFEHPLNGRLVAPNLTQAVRRFTLPELEAIVRQGIKPDGTSVFGMPSASLAAMTDTDLGAIIGFIRSYPEQRDDPGASDHGILTRYRMVTGAFPAQAEVRFQQPWRDTFRNNEDRLGAYLATVACSQCHGLEFEGGLSGAPPLREVHDYDRFEFFELLEKGLAPGGREVGRMSRTARKRFAPLSEAEMDALFVHLKSRS